MKRKTSTVIGLALFISGITIIPSTGAFHWLADCHSNVDDNDAIINWWSKETAVMVYNEIEWETYDDHDYDAYWCEDAPKSWITDSSLPESKIWFIYCHGDKNWYGRNCLCLYDDKKIWPEDIPSLDDVQGGGHQVFAFATACYSMYDSFWWWVLNLHEAFLDRGCLCYMGYKSTVDCSDAHDFAVHFYDYATRHDSTYTIKYSMNLAKQDVPAVNGNICYTGNGNLRIVDPI